VFEGYGPGARRAGVALITAMGFDYAPGDMLAALTADGMGALDEIVLAYAVRGFGATRGTAQTALGMMAGGDAEWRGGELASGARGVGGGSWDFPDPIGRQRMLRYPAGEHITVPRHVRTERVRTLLTASTVIPLPLVPRVAPLVMAPFQLAMRTPLRRALGAVTSRLPEGPSEESRRGSSFTIVCEARTCTGSPPGPPSRERFAAPRPDTTARARWHHQRRSTHATSWMGSAASASSTRSSERLPGLRRAVVRVVADRVRRA
jgi:short subunit dehydrogenase-like uncharacterized protein